MNANTELAFLSVLNLVLAILNAGIAWGHWRAGKHGALAWRAILVAVGLSASALCAYGLWGPA